jgi:hypothetical protein
LLDSLYRRIKADPTIPVFPAINTLFDIYIPNNLRSITRIIFIESYRGVDWLGKKLHLLQV